jgi:hypothetical protein
LTYGLCKLFALIIYHEEKIFRDSFAAAIGLNKPMPPIREEIDDDALFSQYMGEYDGAIREFEQTLESTIREAVQNTNLPPGVVGLIPDGNRKVEWRWKGPVFEDGTEDILNSSIVVRNLQELGVNSIEALRYLFPDKTDEERSAMLSGYPFRMAQATQQSIGQFLSLINDMRQTPHPQSPDLPLLADPKLDLTPYVYRALDFLKRELTYAGAYNDDTGSGDPTTLDSIERTRADRGYPASTGPERPTFIPDTFGSTGGDTAPGGGTAGGGPESMAGGVQQTNRQSERDAELPTAGSLLNTDPTGTGTEQLSLAGTNLPSSTVRCGDADLSAPSNAGVLPDTTGTGADLTAAAERTKSRRVSRSSKRRKS